MWVHIKGDTGAESCAFQDLVRERQDVLGMFQESQGGCEPRAEQGGSVGGNEVTV